MRGFLLGLSAPLILAGAALSAGADNPARPGQQPTTATVSVPVAVASTPSVFELVAMPMLTGSVVPMTELVPADTNLLASCTVRQILASAKEGGLDAKLAALKSQLSKPPFNSYKSFKLLAENDLELADTHMTKLTLQTQQALGLVYMEKLAVAKGKPRMRMRLTLAGADGKALLDTLYAIDEGGTLLQAGQPFQDGTFVLAVSCKTR